MALLTEIEDRLVERVPEIVRGVTLSEPIYAIVIQYFGLDSYGDLSPNLRMPCLSRREAIISSNSDTAPSLIWDHDEFDDDLAVVDADIGDSTLTKCCGNWYASLKSGTTNLTSFREMVQRASKRLNQLDWHSISNVTDDFVVYPGDMSHYFCGPISDMQASIPDTRMASFRERRLLGTDPWWQVK